MFKIRNKPNRIVLIFFYYLYQIEQSKRKNMKNLILHPIPTKEALYVPVRLVCEGAFNSLYHG